MDNPYSLTFGKIPYELISRTNEISEMVDNFNSETPNTSVYIITGVRGSGKTVTMSAIIEELKKDKKWIIITLNANRDLLQSFAASLYEEQMMKPLFIEAGIGINTPLGISVTNNGPAADVEVQIKKMLSVVKKHKKRVMIAIDEATNNSNFKIFASSYQMMLIENLPVYFIMTGLYKNINSLQNEKNLTFLYRAPKYELKPLSIIAMSNNYKKNIDGITKEEADKMAALTKGYSYAFQTLGYLKCKYGSPLEEILPEFDEMMERYCYEKIWSELTEREKEIMRVIIQSKTGRMKAKDIKKMTGLTDQSYPTYRKSLSMNGIIDTRDYGYCEVALPRFKEIIARIDV
ncbi:MAG: ATP-binding protein [Lachnospiraceae bacterium]|nr:ATP-binding protein [Lachnospiraceae bacterium]